jgi:hypothetical protein
MSMHLAKTAITSLALSVLCLDVGESALLRPGKPEARKPEN